MPLPPKATQKRPCSIPSAASSSTSTSRKFLDTLEDLFTSSRPYPVDYDNNSIVTPPVLAYHDATPITSTGPVLGAPPPDLLDAGLRGQRGEPKSCRPLRAQGHRRLPVWRVLSSRRGPVSRQADAGVVHLATMLWFIVCECRVDGGVAEQEKWSEEVNGICKSANPKYIRRVLRKFILAQDIRSNA
ncbi:hypothetical protein B0H10DRAFT_1944391 [Mycena sp. CBHHK59/15]|nr:hypothetical protein B0H10DRAFT_1944391 [Mycena sp. CBHHK59/15]